MKIFDQFIYLLAYNLPKLNSQTSSPFSETLALGEFSIILEQFTHLRGYALGWFPFLPINFLCEARANLKKKLGNLLKDMSLIKTLLQQ